MRVWLPPVPPRAVLYLNDGQNVFADGRSRRPTWRADEVAIQLVADRRIVPVAIVGIDHAGAQRWTEYLPYPDPHNARARRAEADRYADLVVERIVPAVLRLHPELGRVRHRAIGGSSYGGVAALHTAVRHPRAFDRLLIESAPLWVGDGRPVEDARRGLRRARIWVGVGTAESASAERSRDLVALSRRLARALRVRNEVKVRIVGGAAHREDAWAARLPAALRWLFSP